MTLCGELGDQADLSVGDVSPGRPSCLTTIVVDISVKLLSKVWLTHTLAMGVRDIELNFSRVRTLGPQFYVRSE